MLSCTEEIYKDLFWNEDTWSTASKGESLPGLERITNADDNMPELQSGSDSDEDELEYLDEPFLESSPVVTTETEIPEANEDRNV
jgi:hypothetical protein